ncbi:hypothetical protein DSO57_1029510 [Entomophthora muscae]|uniref:Uncharacterized protein n=1 Tax=Entomophthora muscae TaxID=34485 RepID=A0ACC2S342_9FUNG|nr:hypothetical protein DSO57_1029510 [Entomophthora muscae]
MNILYTTRIEEACVKALSIKNIETSLYSRLKKVVESNSEPPEEKKTADGSNSRTIPFNLVSEVSKLLIAEYLKDGSEGTSKFWLHELIKGSQLILEKPKPKTKSKELEQRLQNILRDQSNQEYYRMVSQVDPKFSVPATPREPLADILSEKKSTESRETYRQVSAIINIAFTIIAVFVAIYWISPGFSQNIGNVSILNKISRIRINGF